MKPPMGPVCARCPRVLGHSCCEVQEGEYLATLTRADVARITGHSRLAARRFVLEDVLAEETAAEYEVRHPLYRGYFRRGPIIWSLAVRDGACVFFVKGEGCSLPPDVRPVACRLYPFERWPDGGWSVAMGRYGNLDEARAGGSACLAVEESESMEQVLEAFGTTRETVEALGAQLEEESRAHGRG